jgi:hypothetical protein
MSEKNGLEIAQEEMMKAAREFKFENCEKDCYANEIWNAAIEAALEIAEDESIYPESRAVWIRKLKK